MKLLTKNLTYFALFFVIGTLIFRYSLSFFLEDRAFTLVWISAAIYFIYNFIIGWIFGKRDYVLLPLFDIGFRFHLVSYVFFNGISLAWFLLKLNAPIEKIEAVYITASIWGIFLAFHFVFYLYAKRQAIKGINKDEIFD